MSSIYGTSKSIEDTEKVIKGFLPTPTNEEENTYRVSYAVHKFLEDSTDGPVEDDSQSAEQEKKRPTEFIGLVGLKSLDAGNLALPEDLTLPVSAATTILTVELAYLFLPDGWGKGFATESVKAVLESCKGARSFWRPYSKLYVRAIVNEGNPASMRVMDKTGIAKRGIYKWTGKPIFLGGEWQTQSNLHIFGLHLLE